MIRLKFQVSGTKVELLTVGVTSFEPQESTQKWAFSWLKRPCCKFHNLPIPKRVSCQFSSIKAISSTYAHCFVIPKANPQPHQQLLLLPELTLSFVAITYLEVLFFLGECFFLWRARETWKKKQPIGSMYDTVLVGGFNPFEKC